MPVTRAPALDPGGAWSACGGPFSCGRPGVGGGGAPALVHEYLEGGDQAADRTSGSI